MTYLLRLAACLLVLLSFNVFAFDTDGDGFSDADEATLGTDPNDPTSPSENKLTASDGAQADKFGFSVSIDGNTALVGVRQDDDNGSNSGSVYVFVRSSNGVWNEQQKLTASDGSVDDIFGGSVSIDGDTAVIGATGDDDNGDESGSAYVYVRSNGVWNEQAKLTASDAAALDSFGYSVSIDGNTALISAHRDNDHGSFSGSAYAYIRSNGVWVEQAKLSASDAAAYDQFGSSVSIDGDTAVIGAPEDDDKGYSSGAAYVFIRSSNGDWNEQQKLTASDGSMEDIFGGSVSIDGDTAVIGAPNDDDNYNQSGSAYVYVRSNGVWSEQAKLTASDSAYLDSFGNSVSINGNTALVGVSKDDDNGTSSGSAYVYERNDGVWSEQAKLIVSDSAAGDNFGYSVSTDGDMAVIGAYGDDDNGNWSGSAYIFTLTPPHQDTPASITGSTSANIEISDFGYGTLIVTDVDGLTDGSYFYVTTPPVNGQALINATTGAWIYTANNSFIGSDPFTVTVTDDLGGTTEQIVTITITPPDSDEDGAYDPQDNCPSVSNADQEDLDEDGAGDACDNDKDGDGFTSDYDHNDLNTYLSTDPDNDGVDSSGASHYSDNVCLQPPGCNDTDPCIAVCYVPPQDNCPLLSNSDQSNIDGDNYGDACDIDIDGDSIRNTIEAAAGMNPNDASDGDQAELSALEALGINKQVPAMGGIGLLALGLSMLGLGAVRMRSRH